MENGKMTKIGYRFEHAFNELIAIEGGYIDDPKDSGGKTRYGITEVVAREYGFEEEIKNLPLTLAKEIYKKNYWDALRLDDFLSDSLCMELFDSAVNVGVSRAGKWLQIALNVFNAGGKRWEDLYVDGVVGEKTMRIANEATSVSRWEKRLVKGLNCWQGQYYMELCIAREKDERFVGGWFDNRVRV